ncbi:MAG: hypothetical protein Q4D30_01140 [Bacteroidales bacterium]|nr:hypothetical protein [Bacteroidales bacterium]
MRTSEIRNQLDQLNAELESIRSMSEQEACEAWNVDAKQDIIDIIEEEISALEGDLEDAERESGDYVHPDYVTDEEFYRIY